MPRKQSRRTKKDSEPKVDLTNLSRAGEHFITSAAEFVVGAGFAIKGTRDLLDNEDGRKFLRDLPSKVAERGVELLIDITEQVKEKEKNKGKRTRKSRSRKIEVE